MRLDVRRPLEVVHAPVVRPDVAERRAVLGDVDRGRRVVARHARQQLEEPFRVHLPAHVRALPVGVVDDVRAVSVRARPHDEAEVVVHAEEVDRRRDRLEIAVPHRRRIALEQVGGILAAEQRIEEPAVRHHVHLARCVEVGRRLGGRVDVLEVEDDPHLGVRRGATQRLHRPAVRQQQMMPGRDRVGLARPARRVLTPSVPDPGDHPRLVVRRPVRDPVAEPSCDRVGVLDERLRGGAARPAAFVLERLRRVPVEERGERRDAAREQLVDESVVEVEAGRVHASAPFGENPRPRDREPERVEPELLHQRDVLGIAVVEVACNRPRVAVAHLAGGRAEAIPDALATPVLVRCAFDLVRRGRGTPDEAGREGSGRRHDVLSVVAKTAAGSGALT